MKNTTLRTNLLVSLIVIISFCAAWLPISLVRAGRLAQDGVVSIERPQDPPAGELNIGPFSTYNGVQLAGPDDPVNLMIELEDAPAVEAFAKEQADIPGLKMRARPQAAAAARAQMARIESAQRKLVSELSGARINARVLSRTQGVFNGVAVEVAAGKMDEIHALPGVKAVHVAGIYYRMMDTATQFIGAPRAWDPSLTGFSFTGDGVVVAVIDDGIDYLHTNFNGSGSQTSYATNDPTVIGDVPGFPGVAIITGYDFAGDNFDAASSDPAQRTPQPDPDPFACDDHGTKVAGAVAGRGVNADGSTYTEPYGLNTPFNSLKIGPGVAPKASLITFKVFGCGGATRGDLIVQAIERALDPNGDGNFSDRADIINMSLGSPFFPLAGSPELTAIENLARAGVIPVFAAGNNGDTYYGINALGQAPNALSVAAMLDNGIAIQNVQVNSPPTIVAQYAAAVSEFGPALGAPGVTGNLVYAFPRDGCAPITNTTLIRGNIAFIDRGVCTLTTKVRNAQAAGATAAIIANNTPTLPLNVGDDGTGRDIKIPNYLLSQTAGDLFRLQLQSGSQLNLSLLFGNVSRQPGLANSYLASSSRGGVFGNAVKPDIAAPGANITSSFSGSGSGAGFLTGTSMSAPIVAGVLALLREKYPNDTPDQLKARLYSTGKDVYSGANNGPPKHGTSSVGAGTVSASDAVATRQYGNLSATNIYGEVRQAITPVGVPVTSRITNNANSAQTYAVTYDRTSDIPGLDLSFPSTVTVPANSGVNFQVIWNLNPANMKHTRDATVSATQSNNPRHWLSEEAGSLLFTIPGSDQTIRLPTYFAARPASNMRTTQNSLNLSGQTGTIALGLTGQQVQTGNNFPTDEISIASPVELQGIDPNDSLTPPSLDFLDIQYVGVRSNFPTAGGISATRILFGVTTYGDWNSPNQFTANVFIDTNRDGAADFQLFNTSLPNAQGGPSDVFVTRLRNIATGAITTQLFLNSFSAAQFNIPPFNTNVMVLPVNAAELGLTDTDGKFDYEVKTSIGNVAVDSSGPFSYDALKPGLWFGGNTLIYFDLNNSTIPVNYNLNDFRAANSEGALILHHHNTRGNRAQILPANLGVEADVAPRPGGNGSVTVADWTQIGRFAAGLDEANLGNEFQRADVAPRTTAGNGQLTVADWVQAGRFAAGLDPVASAGGPVVPPTSSPPNLREPESGARHEAVMERDAPETPLRAPARRGREVSVAVELDAQGGENGFSFSLNFDPALLANPRAAPGGDAQQAILYQNATQAARGRFGGALILPPGQRLPAGKRQVAIVTFTLVEPGGETAPTIEFGDFPAAREVADAEANSLPVAALRLALRAERRPPAR